VAWVLHVKTDRLQLLLRRVVARSYRITIDHCTNDVRVLLLQKFTVITVRPVILSMIWSSDAWNG
jgi:hypothetical protein